MTLASGAAHSYTGGTSPSGIVGIREQLSDLIANISPEDTPFCSMIGTMVADATLVEHQIDALAAAVTSNAQLEGDDFTTTTFVPTSRINARCQISTKGVTVTGTVEALKKAGRGSDVAYQVIQRTKEIKRDMEATCLSNQASTTGTTAVARKTGGLVSWYATTANASRGSGGSAGGWSSNNTAAATDASTANMRAFTESLLKTVLQGVWTTGGNASVIMVGGAQKQVVSTFTGNATRMDTSEDRKLVTSVDIYESDFGSLKVVPNRFQRNRDAHVLQPDMFKLAFLRPLQVFDIARAGDSIKKELLTEWGLVSLNEAASGVVADIS